LLLTIVEGLAKFVLLVLHFFDFRPEVFKVLQACGVLALELIVLREEFLVRGFALISVFFGAL
jgi:hypothetical protein